MSFRGGGGGFRGGNRGGPRGGGFRGGDRGGSRGGFRGRGGGGGSFQQGPPDFVIEMGAFSHACEGDAVFKLTNPEKMPKFNHPVYTESKQEMGKVDEIFGAINDPYFTIKPTEGVVATSFKEGDKICMGGASLLPKAMFLEGDKPPAGRTPIKSRGARGGGPRGRGGPRGGGRGGPRGGRGRGFAPRGGSGGSFRGRGGAPRGRGQ